MSLFELSRKPLATLLLVLIAIVMLPACSTTDEEPMIDNQCGCPYGDVDCHEACIREVTP
jgi:hypothetical protein